MKEVKVERIPPGVTNNPNNGILKGEKIKTEQFEETMKLLDNLYPTVELDIRQRLPYCTCRKDKSEKAHDHNKLTKTVANEDGSCYNCGYEVIWR